MQMQLNYVECPHCGNWYAHSELISHTKSGSSKCWSDGKCVNVNLTEYSFLPFAKCDNCENFFWFDDCKQISDSAISSYIEKTETVKDELILSDNIDNTTKIIVDFLKENIEDYQNSNLELNYPQAHWYWGDITGIMIDDFVKILEEFSSLSVTKEIYLRKQIWQHINDYVRNTESLFIQILKNNRKKVAYNKQQYKDYEKIKIENLRKLCDLLQNDKNSEFENKEVILIEINRELSEFEKATKLIEKLDSVDKKHNEQFIAKSIELINLKSANVFRIS